MEEQFYLILPVIILLLFKWRTDTRGRRSTLLLGLGGLAVVSFGLAQWFMMSERAESAFYMSPPRVWEFLIGSLIATERIPTFNNIHARRARSS